MAPSREGNFTFVTNNAKDFRRLYTRKDAYSRLMLIIPNVPSTEQRIIFDAALDELPPCRDSSTRRWKSPSSKARSK